MIGIFISLYAVIVGILFGFLTNIGVKEDDAILINLSSGGIILSVLMLVVGIYLIFKKNRRIVYE